MPRPNVVLCPCGLAFAPKNERQRYCGARCARRARKAKADARMAQRRADAGPVDVTVRCPDCGRLDVVPRAELGMGCRHCGTWARRAA